MIDKSIIQENYRRMSDSQLMHLAQTEGKELTGDAMEMLQAEFSTRNMDTSIFGNIEEEKTEQKIKSIEKAKEMGIAQFYSSIWSYVLDEKYAGNSNETIREAIIEKGVDEDNAREIILTMESKASALMKAHENDMLAGGLVFFTGAALTAATWASAIHGGTYIIAWGAIVFGAIRFFRGFSNKEKFKKILANIASETTQASPD